MSQPTQCLKITEKSLIFNIASEACYVYILSFQLHFSVSAMFLSNYFWLLSNISQFSQQCCSVSQQYFLFLSNNFQFFSNNFQFLSINSQFLSFSAIIGEKCQNSKNWNETCLKIFKHCARGGDSKILSTWLYFFQTFLQNFDLPTTLLTGRTFFESFSLVLLQYWSRSRAEGGRKLRHERRPPYWQTLKGASWKMNE